MATLRCIITYHIYMFMTIKALKVTNDHWAVWFLGHTDNKKYYDFIIFVCIKCNVIIFITDQHNYYSVIPVHELLSV